MHLGISKCTHGGKVDHLPPRMRTQIPARTLDWHSNPWTHTRLGFNPWMHTRLRTQYLGCTIDRQTRYLDTPSTDTPAQPVCWGHLALASRRKSAPIATCRSDFAGRDYGAHRRLGAVGTHRGWRASLKHTLKSLKRTLKTAGAQQNPILHTRTPYQAWTRFCAGSSPNSISNSVASAACSHTVGTSARSAALKASSTNVAGSLRPGGRPIPMRTR